MAPSQGSPPPLIHKAWSLAFQGQTEMARALFDMVLATAPDAVDAVEGLAVLDMGIPLRIPSPTGDSAPEGRALKDTEEALGQGDHGRAEAILAPLLETHPEDTTVRCLAGRLALERHRTEEACTHFTHVLSAHPTHGEALLGRAASLLFADDLARAEATYRVLLARGDGVTAALTNMGVIMRRRGRLRDALEWYERALARTPDTVPALINLADLSLDLGETEKARNALTRALALDPDNADIHNNLGLVHLHWGEREAATAAFERALTLRPDFLPALDNLCSIKTFTMDDPALAWMRARLDDARPPNDRRILHGALYRALTSAGEETEALPHLWEANRLTKVLFPYDIHRERRGLEAIKALFADAAPARAPNPAKGEADWTPRLVFIIGLPRSGSTLLEQILSSHPKVQGLGESQALNESIHALRLWTDQGGPKPNSPEAMAFVREAYLTRLAEGGVTGPVVVDKQLFNFRWVGFIRGAFPEARILATQRDPMAVGWSIWKSFFRQEGTGFASDLGDIGGFIRLHDDMMTFWRALISDHIHTWSYEGLIADQEGETRRLLDLCDLEWDPACLAFQNTRRGVRTASALQVRQALYKGSSEAWKRHAEALKPLADALAAPLPGP